MSQLQEKCGMEINKILASANNSYALLPVHLPLAALTYVNEVDVADISCTQMGLAFVHVIQDT